MKQRIDIRHDEKYRDFHAEVVKHASLRSNWRLIVALGLLVGFSVLFGYEYITTAVCTAVENGSDSLDPDCVPEAERQWLRGLLNTIVGAVIGAALSSTQE